MKLSLVIPCYNEEGNVEKFVSETRRVFGDEVTDYEFVFVNDGSRDGTYGRLRRLYEENRDIQVIPYAKIGVHGFGIISLSLIL